MNAPPLANALESVRSERPDYRFTFEPAGARVRAMLAGVALADSERAMVMRETRLAPVYYFPWRDVRMDLMHRTDHHTHCPFKGNASYWSVSVDDRVVENVAWSYEEPLEEALAIRGYVAFYADELDALYEGGHAVEAVAAGEGVVFANPLLGWLLQDAPNAPDPAALTAGLVERMRAAGIDLWRLHVIIRTLHPQLTARAYRWHAKGDGVSEAEAPNSLLSKPEFLNSPLVPIFDGAGGIRRRLDIDGPVLDFPVLEDLHREGATDYVAMPMVFSDGQINVITMASNRPGGFSTRDLGHVYEVLGVLARLYEVHATRGTAETLLDTYLGRHAGERVLNGLIKRGDGETIDAVIWFCDLRESSALAQTLPREEFLATLNEYFDCLAGAVLAHEGQVLRFIGDAALAIFPVDEGPPGAGGRHACERALAAARDADERIREVNRVRAEAGRVALRYGLALHTGEVTFGNIGTKERLEFTVIGDAANQAARIESMCKTLDRPLILSEAFIGRAEGAFVSLGRHALRGIAGETELFVPG